ncbi:phage tail protein [Erwinia pyrifoliae]|uniref:Phage tail protein n=1 Tax=Erwinia pyrifoliae TaxID=79967 RepID=A0ABY5XCW5_ERWPY|nr:phage tail protein [Erwinia pyrifoliae]MCT2387307.1 phage tail protein [Erwinia pyrifoliae]MCU8587093.1 phage tail protein [Erwinia pyrifoliae]UWS30956.1 phage tail protein [Erwinia pyrifoliae]UWS35246.1 phage tail protein [Erwinia pyrifoliae]
MNQMESLTAFIEENMPPRAMQMFLSAMDDCELIRSEKGIGLGQRRIGILRYSVVLVWDDFPYRICPPARLYALVLCWVKEHANALRDELKLPDPVVDPEFNDDGTASIQVTVVVADEIILRPAESGAVPLNGQRWDVVYPELWTAEEGEVFTRSEGQS